MTATGYTRAQITLHWVTVILVALQYLFHEGISDAFEAGLEAGRLSLTAPAALHIATGSAILVIAIWRLAIRSGRGAVLAPEAEPAWAAALSVWAHRGFYVLLILLPVTGGLAWGLASAAMGEAHEVLRGLMILLILAHVGAVVVHQLVWRTGVLARMTRPGG